MKRTIKAAAIVLPLAFAALFFVGLVADHDFLILVGIAGCTVATFAELLGRRRPSRNDPPTP